MNSGTRKLFAELLGEDVLMEAVINIFKSLGVDETIFVLFGLFVALYFVLKFVLFGKLQEVLEMREGKTTGLEGNANKKFAEAEEMLSKYEEKIEKSNAEAQAILAAKKSEVIARERSKYKEAESKVEKDVEAKRAVFVAELNEQKKSVMTNADSLSENLVQKLTN
jgi:F-type H+-transporting ATPase subunit b